ncbi:10719_t:CDS:2 [Scutellospora calospora]|uniref:10719_t:CDS:1 n=1 Tax=Scutellospora calospora TaxID=85575 RepID=A0ACA9KZW1_9GLOM|nr:10719_t:CDS:2 [Scutellospora calospora]
MGKSGSGKTSMRSIIFHNYVARDTRRLGATIDVENSRVRFLGNLVLNLWDCGGQETFMENYFASQREHIFRNVEVLIYVFDVESREIERDMHYYQDCLEAILANSKDAKIFCLIHKMDLVQEELRNRAWSSIVHSLIPNVRVLESHLQNFATICEADEVVLFERTTFLVISHSTRIEHPDVHSKAQAQFRSMEIRQANFAAFFDILTTNTYVMVIMSDPTVAATQMNISVARKHFEKLEVAHIAR